MAMGERRTNVDEQVAAGFGDEWSRFDQSDLSESERLSIFEDYFHIFPWQDLPESAVGADFGCGSGRWAAVVAPRVGRLYCVDASESALNVARKMLGANDNCEFVRASVGDLPLAARALDFGYSLGVLHHVPDTAAGLAACTSKLKRGAPFLLYLYYRFDNRPRWYRWLWACSEAGRSIVSRLPFGLRYVISQLIAAMVYWPLARLARAAGRRGRVVESWPLAYYRELPFYVMRTDALDRFGTRLEQRFTRAEIQRMMTSSGLENIRFSERPPFWCAVGFRT